MTNPERSHGHRRRSRERVGVRPPSQPGVLTVAAAPIGQPGDASPRLVSALCSAPLIAAEDTRRVRRLAAALGVTLIGRVVSYYDAVETTRAAELVAELRAGTDILLITDAGMPGVSDPGYRLVAAAAESGVRVTALPGPSAVTAAIAVSGLPSDRFAFEGFPPRKAGDRRRRFAELAAERRTMIFFEAPRRLAATLAELAAAFGADRPAVACRELTKSHEEVRRGTLGELARWALGGVLGEVTLVIGGAPRHAALTPDEAAALVRERVRQGDQRTSAISAVARENDLPRRAVYAAVLRAGAE